MPGMTQNPDDLHSGMHFCIRCETWQKRGVIHHCEATARYLKAKAENRIVYDEPEFVPVGGPRPVNKPAENAPNHGQTTLLTGEKAPKTPVSVNKRSNKRPVVNKSGSAVNNLPPATAFELTKEAETVNKDRKTYLRDYMRKKRAGAKASAKDA
jgi:hypothetical protein